MDFHSVEISIVMAVYNGAPFLKAQVDSILAQNVTNYELIIIDDASSDNSFQILQNLAKHDPRIVLYQNDKNMGFVSTFEKGIRLARGSFIALSDQDDVWLVDHLEKLKRNIGNCSLVFSDSYMLYGKNPTQEKFSSYVNIPDLQSRYDLDVTLMFSNFVRGASSMFSSELKASILPFPKGLKFHDHWIAFHANQSNGLKFISDVTCQYRRHENTVTIEEKTHIQKLKKFDPISFLVMLSNNKKLGKVIRVGAHPRVVAFINSNSMVGSVYFLFFILHENYHKIFQHSNRYKYLLIIYIVSVFMLKKGKQRS